LYLSFLVFTGKFFIHPLNPPPAWDSAHFKTYDNIFQFKLDVSFPPLAGDKMLKTYPKPQNHIIFYLFLSKFLIEIFVYNRKH
jgi:hypothetical protein